jgi:membrane protease YdiL (CAAX protease family)
MTTGAIARTLVSRQIPKPKETVMSAIEHAAARVSAPAPTRTTSEAGLRRELGLFLGLVAVLTAALIGVALAEDVDLGDLDNASPLGQLALFGQAFVPAVAAVVARLASTGGVRGLGLRRGESRRYLTVSYTLPVLATLAAYGVVWATGAGELDPAKLAAEGPFSGASEGTGALLTAALALTLGVVPFTVLALGEEIGWRGLMAARLAERMSLPKVALWTGLAWAAFHLPLMLFIPGAVEGVPTLYAVAVFTIGLVALSYPLAWLRLRAHSVWPATIMHAAGNAAIYLVGDALTRDVGKTEWFSGETGLLLCVSSVLVAVGWWRFAGGRWAAGRPSAGLASDECA